MILQHHFKLIVLINYIVCNQPTKFGGCRDRTYIICHVTFQDHVIKGSLVTLWNEGPHCLEPPTQVWWPKVLW